MSVLWATLAATVALPSPTVQPDQCRGILAPRATEAGRVVTEADLTLLRDIGGSQAATAGERAFTISPDGRRAAFQVHQGDPDRNSYCAAIVMIDLRRRSAPIVADTSDELIRYRLTVGGRLDYPFGIARTVTPHWSPDGRSVSFLKQAGGRIQAWTAAIDGTGARQSTSLHEGVDDLRYDPGTGLLLLSSRPDAPARHAALEREGLTGYHYDDRFAPASGPAPFPSGPAPIRYSTLDLATGRMGDAVEAEITQFTVDGTTGLDPGTVTATSSRGDIASVRPEPGGILDRKQRLSVRTRNGETTCVADVCRNHIVAHWWSRDGRRVEYLRREGTSSGLSAFYSWHPNFIAPVRLSATQDLLFGCTPSAAGIVCMRETSIRPRHLAIVDPASGKVRVAFDPNPEMQALALGRTERLHLLDDFGQRLFADLVYPVGYRPGVRYPLVIVQYESVGFLRGGTGDEYPIQALAGRGFMVLSMNRPPPLGLTPDARTFEEASRKRLDGFLYRRAVHSGVVAAVRLLVGRGLVDPAEVGLTGLSEGASEVQWALAHDERFAATAMSGCCWGPQTAALTGLAQAREFREMGFPGWASPAGRNFWEDLSLVPHAGEVRTPTLIQASDDELLDAVDAYTELQAADAPIALMVFPGEHHVKWQPAHRLAIYRRNVEWFAFWLQGRSDHADAARWQKLRIRLDARTARAIPVW